MELKGKRVAVLVEQQYQEMEVWYPVYRLKEAGCQVTLVGPKAGETYPSKLGYPAKSDRAAAEYVMSVNGGNQTVPTVLFPDGTALTNPSAAQVKAQLSGLAG